MNTTKTTDGVSAVLSTDGLDRKIEAMLDAAFKELQHDTGPQDPEYRFQRQVLKNEFKRILRSNARDNPPSVSEGRVD